MKITDQDYKHIKETMQKTLYNKGYTWQQVLKHYVDFNIGKDHEKRASYDLMNASNLTSFICDTIYKYANDTHLNTAIRHIIKEL